MIWWLLAWWGLEPFDVSVDELCHDGHQQQITLSVYLISPEFFVFHLLVHTQFWHIPLQLLSLQFTSPNPSWLLSMSRQQQQITFSLISCERHSVLDQWQMDLWQNHPFFCTASADYVNHLSFYIRRFMSPSPFAHPVTSNHMLQGP